MSSEADMTAEQDVREVNFDGLVGPTHNYAGLAHRNVARSEERRAGNERRSRRSPYHQKQNL